MDIVYAGEVVEATDCVLRGVVKDSSVPPAALGNSSISALSWQLYSLDPDTAIVALTSLSPVSTYIDASGNLTMPVTAAQNAMVNSTRNSERHRACFKITHSSGKVNWGFIDFDVVNNPVPT